jgi:hypothetical protein
MKSSPFLPVLVAALSLLTTAHAQSSFYGTDTFNDNSLAANWTSLGSTNGGAWTETNGRLEFTADATSTAIINTNRAASFISWKNDTGNNTSYTTSWVATSSFTIDTAAVAVNGASWLGFEVSVAGAEGGYYGIYLTAASSGNRIFTEQGIYDGVSAYTRTVIGSTGNLDPALDMTDVLLKISYDGSSQALTSAFSFDSGATFLTYANSANTGHFGGAATGNTSSWNPGPTSGFGLEYYGALYGNGSSTGPLFLSGQAYADNLSISAIPEPSTYAALAGLAALGLAVWRRRT